VHIRNLKISPKIIASEFWAL